MYLLFTQEVDITARLKNFHIPTFLAYGAFEYTVAPVESWSPIRHKFKNLTVRVFDKSAHSPQHEEAPLFDAELLRWLRI